MTGKVFIVTGGTHGIGRACVEHLAGKGARVVFTGRDRDAGAEVESTAVTAKYVPCDVAVEADCRRAVEVALALEGGRIAVSYTHLTLPTTERV